MFCIQCEQTINTPQVQGCSFAQGMCGKTAEVSDLQDVLVTALQGLSFWASLGYEHRVSNLEMDRWSTQALFSTLTNVNFDANRIMEYIETAETYKTKVQAKVTQIINEKGLPLKPQTKAALINTKKSREELLQLSPVTAVNCGFLAPEKDLLGLYLLCLYGLKGAAAYMEHAAVLGQTDQEVYAEYHRIMSLLGDRPKDTQVLFDTAMQIGTLNFKIMEMLDRGSTSIFGNPEPTLVNVNPVKGHCILVSGHDLEDLRLILEQTQGKNINVYTHGEMLPAHSYPELKKYPHLVGNYGSAWQKQQKEFADFPGSIVMTSNCIINPDVGQYKDRIYTRSIVGWPEVTHIEGSDFSVAIEKALSLPGFPQNLPEHKITIGFGQNALMTAAPAVIEQIKSGNIRHFFLVGGCDGDRNERSYYEDFVDQVPEDCVVLTLACGKYRFNKKDLGNIQGIPRLLDIGQCNDSYSAIQLALALSKEFNCSVNDLPLTLVLSWFEQKAIVILLTLLSLGVKGIYVGPTVPAFLTENLISILQQQFNLRVISTPEKDLKTILAPVNKH